MSETRVDKGYKLKVRRVERGHRKLTADLSVTVHTKYSRTFTDPEIGSVKSLGKQGTRILVHQGFVTDYSSIPTALHWIVRWSRVDIAGVIHDFLYREFKGGRCDADDVWRELATAGDHSASEWQAAICWVMLRGFGGWSIPRGRPPEHRKGWLVFGVVLAVLVLVLLSASTLVALSLLLLLAAVMAPLALVTLAVQYILSRGNGANSNAQANGGKMTTVSTMREPRQETGTGKCIAPADE